MGKRNNKNKSSGYVHKKTNNKNARESDERRISQMTHMTIARLQKVVDKQIEYMKSYIPIENVKKKARLDPNYQLKGAARPALDFYKDPNFDYSETEAVNIYEQYKDGKMWDHVEGQKLLEATLELGVAFHNAAHKSKDAIRILKSVLSLDSNDHLKARYALLRCYMDEGLGLEARCLIEKYPEDTSACFTFGLALLDHVAYYINKEKDSSLEIANSSLRKAFQHHNYAIWVIVLHSYFSKSVELMDEMLRSVSTDPTDYCVGGILDALLFYEEDAPIWLDTEGAVDWVVDFLKSNQLEFSNPGTFLGSESDKQDEDNDDDVNDVEEEVGDQEVDVDSDSGEDEGEEEEEGENTVETKTNAEIMYLNMYRTSVRMAAAASSVSSIPRTAVSKSTKSAPEAKDSDGITAVEDIRIVANKLLAHLQTLDVFNHLAC